MLKFCFTFVGLLEFIRYNLYEFRDNVVGALEVTGNIHNVLYNELIPHSPPISLNTYNTALLRHLTNDDSLFINAVYQPILITQVIIFTCVCGFFFQVPNYFQFSNESMKMISF